MKKLIENALREFQINKLNEEEQKYLNQKYNDDQSELNEDEEDEENINNDEEEKENNEDFKNKEELANDVLEKYKPIFESMLRHQITEQSKNQNENNINTKRSKTSKSSNPSKKYFKVYTISTNKKNNSKKPIGKNNFKIEEDFVFSTNINNKDLFDPNLRKNELEYNYHINQQKKNINKIISNRKIPKIDNNDLLLQLKNIPKPQISKEMTKELGLEPKKYDVIIDKLISEITEVRQDRQRENLMFQEKIKQMEGEIIGYQKKKLRKNKTNIGFKKKIPKILTNKRSKSNYKIKSIGYGIQPKKRKFITSRKINKTNTKDIQRNNNILKNNFISNDDNKIIKNIFHSVNDQKTYIKKANIIDNNYKGNPKIAYYQELLKQIKEINKQNEIISKKYQTQIETVQNQKNKKQKNRLNNDKIGKRFNLKSSAYLIKKGQKLISDKIIDDLLLECVYELKNIEAQRENNQKVKLINQIETARHTINMMQKDENDLISNINNNINKKNENNVEPKKNKNNNEMINFNNFLIAKNVVYKANPSFDLVIQRDRERKNFRDYMQLNGSFYSDYDIFKIYDVVVESQCDNILEKELDSCIKQMDEFVDNFEKKEG